MIKSNKSETIIIDIPREPKCRPETKAEFRARVRRITGEKYSNIPIMEWEHVAGPILAARNNVLIMGKNYCFESLPDGGEKYYEFARVIL